VLFDANAGANDRDRCKKCLISTYNLRLKTWWQGAKRAVRRLGVP
jgi:hypothetical protein